MVKLSKLKITFLASEWGSSKGGLSTLNRELAINIAKDPRVEVSYFVPRCNDEDKKAAHSHKIELIKAVRRPGFDDLELLNFPPKNLQIDIVVGNGVKLGHQAQIIKESHECKWIHVVHTDSEELGIYKEYANPILNAQKKHQTEIELCKLADFVVPVGPKLCRAFQSYLATCKSKHYFFEFTPGIVAELSELEQRKDKPDGFEILCFGRGDSKDFKIKGFDIAARAVAELPDSTLKFVGATEEELEETRKRFLHYNIPPSRLRVRPFVNSKDELKKVFCEADLLVMPSRTEGFGFTGLEALSAGLPILVSRNSGFGEALMRISLGSSFVVNSDESEAWVEAIKDIKQKERSIRLQDCQALRDSYQESYGWKKQSESLIGKMLSIVKESTFIHATNQYYRSLGQVIVPIKPDLGGDRAKERNKGSERIFQLLRKGFASSSCILIVICCIMLYPLVMEIGKQERMHFYLLLIAISPGPQIILGKLVRKLGFVLQTFFDKDTRYQMGWICNSARLICIVIIASTVIFCSALCGYDMSFSVLDCAIVFFVSFVSDILRQKDKIKDIAAALAWSYFGYLKLALPKLERRVAESDKFRYKITEKKVFIVLPEMHLTCADVTEADKRMRHVGSFDWNYLYRGNVSERIYSHAVYSIKLPLLNGTSEDCFCIIECAEPLLTLYDENSELAEVAPSAQERDQLACHFSRKLEECLAKREECKGSYELVPIPRGQENQVVDILVERLNPSITDPPTEDERKRQ